MAHSKVSENMLQGELYWAWDEDLQASMRGIQYGWYGDTATRRRKVELWRNIIGDTRPLPPVNLDPKQGEAPFEGTDPFVEAPISVDHGLNIMVGQGIFLNFNLFILDTCLITIGENVLFGPNVCLYGAIHPMDTAVRRGWKGPEAGKEIHIEDDVWIGGSALILAGARVGRGSTVEAGSVVTKDVPPFHFVVGNPASVTRRIDSEVDSDQE